MKEKHKVSILVAVIPAIATLIVGFLGGQATVTNSVTQTIQNSATITVNEGESTGEALNRLLEMVENLRSENNKQKNEIDALNQKIETLEEQNNALKGNQSEYAELQKKYDELQKKYDELQKKYDSVVKENEEFQRKWNEKQGLTTPSKDGVALASLGVFNDNDYHWHINEGGKEDTLGADYSHSSSYIVVGGYGCGYAEYFIDGKYTRLTGSIAPHKSASGEKKSSIQIYGDDKLLWGSDEVGTRTDVFSFEIGADKLAGVRFLKIVQKGSDYVPLLLVDWTLS